MKKILMTLFFVAITSNSYAFKTEITDYHVISNDETMLDAREKLLSQIKVKAASEAGSYIQGKEHFSNGVYNKQIDILSANIVKLTIIKEDLKISEALNNKKSSVLVISATAFVDDSVLTERIEEFNANIKSNTKIAKLQQENQKLLDRLREVEFKMLSGNVSQKKLEEYSKEKAEISSQIVDQDESVSTFFVGGFGAVLAERKYKKEKKYLKKDYEYVKKIWLKYADKLKDNISVKFSNWEKSGYEYFSDAEISLHLDENLKGLAKDIYRDLYDKNKILYEGATYTDLILDKTEKDTKFDFNNKARIRSDHIIKVLSEYPIYVSATYNSEKILVNSGYYEKSDKRYFKIAGIKSLYSSDTHYFVTKKINKGGIFTTIPYHNFEKIKHSGSRWSDAYKYFSKEDETIKSWDPKTGELVFRDYFKNPIAGVKIKIKTYTLPFEDQSYAETYNLSN